MNKAMLHGLLVAFVLLPPAYLQAQSSDEAPAERGAHEREHQAHEEHGDEGDEREEPVVRLTPEQRVTAGISVEPVARRRIPSEIVAPGEVKLNAYRTSKVTPRIEAQIVERHARLGDMVETGAALVTLSSVEMAEAQGRLVVADQEWRRVRSLGRETVSERRYTEARVIAQEARARVKAFGMTDGQVTALLEAGAPAADGTFRLLAPRDGTIIRDEFIEGEFVEPGRVLFAVSDESTVWIEASLSPEEAPRVETGAHARVRVDGIWIDGVVAQAHHALDETTRTLAVHVEVANPDETLHPGRFVETRITVETMQEVIAVPEEAVLRGHDGDWTVFVELGEGEYRPLEVELLRTADGLAVIEGIDAGARLVVDGAFFVRSELAKGGFEIHAH